MATLFVLVLHLKAGVWRIDEAYQSRPDQAALCEVYREKFVARSGARQDERIEVFCQAEPAGA